MDVEIFFQLKRFLGVKSDFGDILPAALAVIPSTALLHPLHKYRHALILNHYDRGSLKPVLNFDGLATSLFRRVLFSTALFSMYTTLLHYRMKYQIEGRYSKRSIHDNVRATQ